MEAACHEREAAAAAHGWCYNEAVEEKLLLDSCIVGCHYLSQDILSCGICCC